MPSTLKVELVTPEKWQQLQQDGKACACVQDSLGFADPPHGRAYVRSTQWADLNKYLVAHEFEHLLEDKATDECPHGYRHKKFFRDVVAPTWRVTAPIAGGILGGPVGAAAGGAFGEGVYQASQARHQPDVNATSAGLRGAARGGLTAGGIATGNPFLGAAGAGAGQAIWQAGSARPGEGSASDIFRSAALGGVGAAGVGKFQLFNPLQAGASGGAGAPGVTGSGGTTVPKLTGGGGGGNPFDFLKNLFGGGGATPATAGAGGASGAGAGAGAGGFSLGKVLGPSALGAGIAGVGQFFGNRQRPEIPELGQVPSINQFRTDVAGKFGPLQNRLQGLSSQALPSALESPIRRQFQNQRKRLYGQFAGAAPGTSLMDTEYRRAEEDLAQRESESIANAQFGFQGQERQNILAQAGVTDQEMGYAQQLAQLDIDTIMARTGMAAEDANQFKQIFGNIGAAVAGAGVMNAFR